MNSGTATADAPTGTLKVEVDSQSMLLGHILEVEIRDGGQRQVASLQGAGELPLPAGLYSVSAMLGDGQLHTHNVLVKPGEEAKIEFQQLEEAGAEAEYESARGRRGAARRRTRGFRSTATDEESVDLEAVEGATVETHEDGRWVFAPVQNLGAVPVANFRWDGQTARVSLPVNPRGEAPRDACIVEAGVVVGRLTLRTSMAPERRVASTIEGMMLSGEMLRGADAMQEGSALLADKYRDPVGAALGGLLLHRIGHLERRSSWVRRLARNFEWLPDGGILWSALLAESEDADKRAEGLAMLLDRGRRRPMFTDGFSLLLNLLRRWPDEAAVSERMAMLEQLSEVTSRVDWKAIALTEFGED